VEASIRAQRDVRLVRERAKIVLKIIDDEEVEIRRNPNFSLNVLAITAIDYDCEVLCEEIGLWRSKPFQASEVGRIGKKARRRCIPARSRNAELSDGRYELVAPTVFSLLQGLVNKRTHQWERGPSAPYEIWMPVLKRNSSGRIFVKRVLVEWQRGLRFSVRAESRFAQDVCWAELNLNTSIRGYLEYMAESFHECLSAYSVASLQPKYFSKQRGFLSINRRLFTSCLPWHLLLETFRYLPEMNHYRNQLAEFVGWDQMEESAERRLSSFCLPDPVERVRNIQIRTFGIKKGFLTFEVFPSE